jgi:hypothetical protein
MSKKKQSPLLGKIKFYADENVDIALINHLREDYKVNITTALEAGFAGRNDDFHYKEAKRQKRFLLTCDSDFLNHRRFPFNKMMGIVILDVPRQGPSLGFISLWLTEHIVPSGKEIHGTKIVIHTDSIDIYLD